MNFLGYRILLSLPNDFPLDKFVVNTLNPHSYCIAKKDKEFETCLKSSNILLPDGVGIVLACRFLYGKKIGKIAGYDIHLHFLEMLQERGGGKVFYLGAAGTTLSLIKERIFEEFPSIEVDVYSPPFKSEFSIDEVNEMVDSINAFAPDVLFVGMTAPKQEKWVSQNMSKLNTKVMCSIGAVFDFYAGTVKRPSKLWINLGLEWLPRMVKEPKRLWKRNLISTPIFLFEMVLIKLKLRS